MFSLQLAVLALILLLPMVLIIAQLRSIAVMLRRVLDEQDVEVVKEFPAPTLSTSLERMSRSHSGLTLSEK